MILYTVDELAELFKVTRGTVALWIRRGELDALRLNDSHRSPLRISQVQVDEFVRRRSGYYRERARRGRVRCL